MADQTSAAGQYIPLSRNSSLSNASLSSVNSPYVGSGKQYQGQSFYDILNRNQLTSAQLKSMHAPDAKIVAKIPVNQSPAAQTAASPAFVPAPDSAYNQELIEETEQHLQTIPADAPRIENLDNVILKNMQEYFNQKAAQEQAAQASSASAPASPQPASADAPPKPAAGANALNDILAKNAVNAEVVDALEVSQKHELPAPEFPEINEPLITPTPALPEIQPESEPVSGFPAYIPAAQLNQTAQSPAGANSSAPTPPNAQGKNQIQPENAQEDNAETLASQPIEETEQGEERRPDGFFHAFGSLFGNVASAATLGFYRPSGEPEPAGLTRVIDPVKKVVWDAPKNILVDMPAGAYHDLTRKNDDASSAESAQDRPSNYRGVKAFGHFRTSIRRNFYT